MISARPNRGRSRAFATAGHLAASGVAVALTACGAITPEEEAGQIFDATTRTLIDFHADVGEDGTYPESATWPCGAGEIELQSDDSEGLTLGHLFSACELDGRVYDGDLPYYNVRLCSFPNRYRLDIEGELAIEGATNFDSCRFEAEEHCNGTFSGRVCGLDLAETSSELTGA